MVVRVGFRKVIALGERDFSLTKKWDAANLYYECPEKWVISDKVLDVTRERFEKIVVVKRNAGFLFLLFLEV